jgi:hypothetical protein
MGMKRKNTPEEFKVLETRLCELGYNRRERGNYYEYIKTVGNSVATVTFTRLQNKPEVRDVSFEVFSTIYTRRSASEFLDGHSSLLLIPATPILKLSKLDVANNEFELLSTYIGNFIKEMDGIIETNGGNLHFLKLEESN